MSLFECLFDFLDQRLRLLDQIGDLRLAGGWLKAKVTAFKPGHTINTRTAKAIREKSC